MHVYKVEKRIKKKKGRERKPKPLPANASKVSTLHSLTEKPKPEKTETISVDTEEMSDKHEAIRFSFHAYKESIEAEYLRRRRTSSERAQSCKRLTLPFALNDLFEVMQCL
eukprot:TRINITY_DN467_c0_g2_i1.p2 TRINITY_DN467_c0_g2~~TRINITY_DN467_c0_g2_i1.p2  ORF type:complete len:111 (+),score=17.06 TRINITY_DN467_c0_g2_i1:418-750(+)